MQGRSQEFTNGGQTRGSRDKVPSGVQGQNMETLENTNFQLINQRKLLYWNKLFTSDNTTILEAPRNILVPFASFYAKYVADLILGPNLDSAP